MSGFFDSLRRKKHPNDYLYGGTNKESPSSSFSALFGGSKTRKNSVSSKPLTTDLKWNEKLEDILTIETKIADGLYGPCYKARLQRLDTIVVAKRLIPENNLKSLDQMKKDIDNFQKLSNENIIPYVGAHLITLSSKTLFDTGSELWILTQYESGSSVLDLIRKHGTLPENAIAVITSQTLKGLKYLNFQKLIHGNLKASNILLSENGTPKLCDYSLARSISKTATISKTQTAKTKSAIYWQAPEIIDERETNNSSDIWSLGITIHEMAEGKAPFQNKSLLQISVLFAGIGNWQKNLSDSKKWSKDLQNFVETCLIEDSKVRKTPDQIESHPFITIHKGIDPESILKPLIIQSDPLSLFYSRSGKEKTKTNKEERFWTVVADSKEHIIFSEDPSNPSDLYPSNVGIKCSRVEKLIEYTTRTENKFLEKYIIFTYPTFTTEEELISLLAARYRGTKEKKEKKDHINIQKSVARIFEFWINIYFKQLQKTRIGRILDETLSSLFEIAEKFETETLNKIGLLLDTPTPITDIKSIIDKNQKPDLDVSNPPELFTFSARSLAQQMTLIERKIIENITPSEFLKQAWNKKGAETKAPWLLFYVDWFNQRSRWFSTAILKEGNVKERSHLLEKFIEIGNEFLNLKNYNGVFEVCACLFSAPISRLKLSWGKISEKHKGMLSNLEDFVDPSHNYKVYRDIIKNVHSPSLPYLGLLLTDFTFMDEANTDQVEELINVEKIGLLGSSILQFLSFISEPYNIKEDLTIRNLLIASEPWNDQDFYNVSRIREDPKQSKEKEKDFGSFFTNTTPTGKQDLQFSSDFTDQDLKILLGASEEIKFEPKECILGDLDEPGGLFRIKKGLVSVERRDARNQYHEIDTLLEGEWFGDSCIFSDLTHHSYTALNETIIEFVTLDLLIQILSSNEHLARRFYKRVAVNLAQRLRDWNFDTKSKGASLRKNVDEGKVTDSPLKESLELKDDDELSRIFNLNEEIVVVQRYSVTFAHAKGSIFITKQALYCAGSIFGFPSKKIIPYEMIKVTTNTKMSLTVFNGDKKDEFVFKTEKERTECQNFITSLRQTLQNSTVNSKQKLIKSPSTFQPKAEYKYQLTLDDWKLMLQGNKSKSYEPNSVILLQNTPYKQRLFQVVSGKCRIEKKLNDNEPPKKVATVLEGQIFGEISFLTQGECAASVITDQKTEILKLEGYFLNIMFQRHLELGAKFYRFLGETLIERVNQKEEAMKEAQKGHRPSKLSIKKSSRSLIVRSTPPIPKKPIVKSTPPIPKKPNTIKKN